MQLSCNWFVSLSRNIYFSDLSVLPVKLSFYLDIFCLLLLVLVFCTNNVQMARSTNNQNKQQNAKTSNRRHLPVLVFGIELILSQKQERATNRSKKQQTANGNTPQKPTTKSISHSRFYLFALALDLWKLTDIKSNEKPERATTGNEKQQKATKSNKKHKQTSELERPKRAIKHQNEQRRAQ